MAKTALVIMAAGIGSRFGGGIKQLAPVGPTGEIIMDYSVHDAIKAGFNKIVFIIRKDIETDFREIIGNRIEKICDRLGIEVAYAFQAIDDLPQGQTVPEGRTKPWGTGQAVLAAKDVINEPFAVLNADDYYGKEAFVKIHDYLVNYTPDKPMDFCMAGFILKNTLSENGGVTRGICKVDENGNLTEVVETSDIEKTADGAAVNGAAVDADSYVSMNMWGLTPEFLKVLEEGFVDFFKEKVPENPLKAEYLIPIFIGELLEAGKVSVKLLETPDTWFGVTYAEDKPFVIESFKKLIEDGEYKADLYSDLV
ncbi:MAG: NDP-sugar synthase [Candidatus Ornithomonoglobus sp.]